MVDLLKRSVAPVTEEAWRELDQQAVRVLKAELSARTVVDFVGPGGWELGAVNLGRLDVSGTHGPHDVPWGVRQVLPLVEVRIPFVLTQMELDAVSRGARDLDLASLEEAARKIAFFEESAVYNGFEPGRIGGILQRAGHPPIAMPSRPGEYPAAVAQGVERLRMAGVPGPYALVLGPAPYFSLAQSNDGGFPPRQIVRDILEGEILFSPAITGGVVLSRDPGCFELTVGQDHSIGYASHDRQQVELFITETFTFRVLQSTAAIELKA